MSKVTRKYQITIPQSVRKAIGLVPGSEVDIVHKGDEFVLKVNPVEDLKRIWRGRFRDEKSSEEYMSEIRGEIE